MSPPLPTRRRGRSGRPSKAMTLAQAKKLMSVVSDLNEHNLGAYVMLCLQSGIRTRKRPPCAGGTSTLTAGRTRIRRCRRASPCGCRRGERGDTKMRTSRRTLGLPPHAVDVLRGRQGPSGDDLVAFDRIHSMQQSQPYKPRRGHLAGEHPTRRPEGVAVVSPGGRGAAARIGATTGQQTPPRAHVGPDGAAEPESSHVP